MSNTWATDLMNIMEELDDDECEKLFLLLEEIPKSKRTNSRAKMAEIIISRYGEHQSILKISKAMDDLQKKDPKVLKLLEPHVERVESMKRQDALKRKHEDEKENER
ncbi:uncharacterized protein KZ484_018781 [Pholidichthys leucotaenia]